MKKKIKNSQPQTKFTGSYKKKECIVCAIPNTYLLIFHLRHYLTFIYFPYKLFRWKNNVLF